MTLYITCIILQKFSVEFATTITTKKRTIGKIKVQSIYNRVVCLLVICTVAITGYTHNPYNGVICNDIILATGVFSSKELWKLSKCK